MLHEAPPKRLGQIVYNQTTTGAPPLILIPSGVNLRGIILRTFIVTTVTFPPPPPGGNGQLIADSFVVSGFPPPPPPPGTPSTARLILITDPMSGFAQLDWPLYLDPGIGLYFTPGPGATMYNVNASWDYASLAAA